VFLAAKILFLTVMDWVLLIQHGRAFVEIMTQAAISSAFCAAISQVSGQEWATS